MNTFKTIGKYDVLYNAMGDDLCELLMEETTENIHINADGIIRYNGCAGRGTRETLSAAQRMKILASVAHFSHKIIDENNASVKAIIPGFRARIKGHIPPLVESPCISIRRPMPKRFPLSNYVDTGVMTITQHNFLEESAGVRNIVIPGKTGSGKTVLANSILGLDKLADLRCITIQEIEELIPPEDHVNLLTDPFSTPPVEMKHLVQDALSMSPDLLVIGETLGPEALDLMMAWNTDHPGVTTVHANSARHTIKRFRQMIELNDNKTAKDEDICDVMHVIGFIKKCGNTRRLQELVKVGYHKGEITYEEVA